MVADNEFFFIVFRFRNSAYKHKFVSCRISTFLFLFFFGFRKGVHLTCTQEADESKHLGYLCQVCNFCYESAVVYTYT